MQAGRGIAATMVVFYHTGFTVGSPKYWGAAPIGAIYNAGLAGVQFFFVLSGFIIYWAHRKDLGKPASLSNYARRRFVRVYPIYWLILTPITIATLWFHRANPAFGAKELFESFALIGPNANLVLGVAWTLFHEVLFYAIFALVIVAPRAGAIAFVTWQLLSLLSLPFGYLTDSMNLLFGFGIASAIYLAKRDLVAPLAWLALGTAGFLGTSALKAYGWVAQYPGNLMFGAFGALIVVAAVSAERTKRLRTPASLILLGDASYVIYLVHLSVNSIGAKMLHQLPPLAAFFTLSALSVSAGVIIHLVVERPLLKMLRARSAPADRVQAPVLR